MDPLNKHQDTLDKLNNKSKRTVLDCIDRPIRKLVLEIHRIGLKTKFSCCGFPYNNEEEPKTHAKRPFIVIHPIFRGVPKEAALGVAVNFQKFASIAVINNWVIRCYNSIGEWHLIYGHNNAGDFYHPKDEDIGIHNYEQSLIAIQGLTKAIKDIPTMVSNYLIIDGNTDYDKMTNGEWQVQPAVPYKKEII